MNLASSMVIQLHRPEKRSESVARAILHDIAARDLPDGTPLGSETALAEAFGVGRSTLREAIRLLELNGLLGLRPGPGGGPYVRRSGVESFSKATTLHMQAMGMTLGQVIDARAAFEPMMARLAAQSSDDAAREQLRGLVADLRAHTPANGAPPPVDFHGCIVAMSSMPVLGIFGHVLAEVVRVRSDASFSEVEVAQMRDDHLAIGDAVLARDAAAADRLMREHYARVQEVMHARFDIDQRIEWA